MNYYNSLCINNAVKLYNKNCGIKEISATITQGEIVGIIGPNGAGKTTLVKAIAGLITLSHGSIKLNEIDTYNSIAKSQIGYMQENINFYYKMTVYEALDFLCKVKFDDHFHEEINNYLIEYNMYDQRNQMVRKLSFGMKRKLAIIMSLLGNPKLLLLDEPTNGIDTAGIIQLKKDIQSCCARKQIILITSHVLDWLEKICTRCIFIKDGYMIQDMQLTMPHKNLELIYEKIYN